MRLLLHLNPEFSTCCLSSSIHPRDKQTVAYRLHLGARAVAYGEKQLIFQGPLPEKIELLADKGLLNLMYSQQIQVQRQDDKIFEVRGRAETIGVPPVLGVSVSSTAKPISLIVTWWWGRSWLVGAEFISEGQISSCQFIRLEAILINRTLKEGKTRPYWCNIPFVVFLPEQLSWLWAGLAVLFMLPIERILVPEYFPCPWMPLISQYPKFWHSFEFSVSFES